jgi:hypothetical protein
MAPYPEDQYFQDPAFLNGNALTYSDPSIAWPTGALHMAQDLPEYQPHTNQAGWTASDHWLNHGNRVPSTVPALTSLDLRFDYRANAPEIVETRNIHQTLHNPLPPSAEVMPSSGKRQYCWHETTFQEDGAGPAQVNTILSGGAPPAKKRKTQSRISRDVSVCWRCKVLKRKVRFIERYVLGDIVTDCSVTTNILAATVRNLVPAPDTTIGEFLDVTRAN